MPPDQRGAVRPFRPILIRQSGTYPRGETGAGTTGGNRQQQIAAADLGNAVEVAELGAILDIDQHPLRARERGQFRSAIIRQPDDPEHVQAGQIASTRQPPTQETACFPGEQGVRLVGEQQDLASLSGLQRTEPAEGSLAAASNRHRSRRRSKRDRDHTAAVVWAAEGRTVADGIGTPNSASASPGAAMRA